MDHPKFLALSDGAWRLWCEGQAYCQKHLTDGVIPVTALKGFRYYSSARVKALTKEFVPGSTTEVVPGKGPCWHQRDNVMVVHDYLDWNDSRLEVLQARSDAKARQRLWKERVRRRVSNASGDALGDALLPSGVACTSTGDSIKGGESLREGSGASVSGVGAGVMAGSLPRDHLNCRPPCIRMCISQKQHAILRERHGGGDGAMDTFYAEVRAHLSPDVPLGDTPWKFWEAQFTARFGSTAVNPKTAGNAAALARFVARGKP